MEPLPGGCEVAGDVHFDSHPIGASTPMGSSGPLANPDGHGY